MATSRNVFRRGGGPVRVTNLGSTDPFAKMVADLHKQLGFMQDQKAIGALAQGDPDGFLEYALPTMSGRTGDDRALWEGLVSKAQNKIDEQKWAAIVKNDDSRLEEFLQHLYDKLDGVALGTSESYSIITAIDGVNKSIQARDENKADQKALLSYIETKDHMAYARYLGGKLARTTDLKAAMTIQNDILELRTRQATEDRVDRTKKRTDIAIAYLESGLPAGKAIAQLQELALDKNITAEEVNAIQTLVTQIHDREESEARRAAGSAGTGTGVDEAAFGQNYSTYKAAQDKVDQILNDGGNPAEPYPGKNTSPLDDLKAAASILQQDYMTSAKYKEQYGKDGSTARGNAAEIDQFLNGIPGRNDQNTIKNSVKSDAASFAKEIKELDPVAAAKRREARIAGLSGVYSQLVTPNAQATVKGEMEQLAADQRNATTELSAKSDLNHTDQQWLNDSYKAYVDSVANPVGLDQFLQAAIDAGKEKDKNAKMRVFAEETGVKYALGFAGQGNDTNTFADWKGPSGGKGAQQWVTDLADVAEQSNILDYRATAMKAAGALLSIPGATPFGPVGSPQFNVLGLTAQDLIELRRGAGLIGQVTTTSSSKGRGVARYGSEEDLTSYENSDAELRREMRAQKDLMLQQEQAMRGTVEDSILQPLVGNEFPPIDMSMMDPGMTDQALPAMQPEPQQDYGYPGLDKANAFLDEGVTVDIPGAELPSLPFSNPYKSEPRDAHDYMDSLRGADNGSGAGIASWEELRGTGDYSPDRLEANSTPPIRSGQPY